MRLLILTATAGEGHNSLSHALKDYIRKYHQDDEVLIFDLYKDNHKLFAWVINDLHFWNLKHFPHIMRFQYKLSLENKVDKNHNGSVTFGRIAQKDLLKKVEEFKPNAIISMHTFATGLLNYLQRKEILDKNIKLFSVIPDYSPHPDTETNLDFDCVFTPCKEIHPLLINTKDFKEEQLNPTGLPVHSKFYEDVDKEEFAKEMNIDISKFTLMIFSGGIGIGNNAKVVKTLMKAKSFKNINIIVVNGKNKKSKKQVDKLIEKYNLTNVYNYGFIMTVHKLMSISTCMIGKLGALTTNECLIKYLPIIVPFKPPYHEYWNMKFLEKEGVIKVIDGYKNLPNGIDELVENPSILEKIKANMEHLRKPNACKDMAEKIKNVTDGNS